MLFMALDSEKNVEVLGSWDIDYHGNGLLANGSILPFCWRKFSELLIVRDGDPYVVVEHHGAL